MDLRSITPTWENEGACSQAPGRGWQDWEAGKDWTWEATKTTWRQRSQEQARQWSSGTDSFRGWAEWSTSWHGSAWWSSCRSYEAPPPGEIHMLQLDAALMSDREIDLDLLLF